MTGRTRVLILNGTSMAAIQALTVLDPQRYEVHVCDPDPKCWGRFHRHCARFFRSPHLRSNPKALFDFILQRLQSEKYDLILPVHEEGLLLAKYRSVFKKHTHLLIADVNAFHTIMHKRLCLERAQSLNIPTPPMKIAHSLEEVARIAEFPCYVKLPYGTSSSGVRRIASSQECIEQLRGFAGSPEFILQKEVVGDLCAIQSVFANGKLIGSHQYQALGQGYGGGASRRLSLDRDDLREYVTSLGTDLHWDGPLMLDFIHDRNDGISYLIEGNPRIGETFNATLAGLNICELIINLSLGKVPPAPIHSRPNVRSHQMFTEVMAAVKHDDPLMKKWSVALSSLADYGKYTSSVDEIIHPLTDPVSLVATGAILLGMPFFTRDVAARLDSAATRSMAAGAKAVSIILESNWSKD